MAQGKKAVFLDIDGTLITMDSGPFVDDIMEIEAAKKRGHLFFFSTGRSYAFVPGVLKKAPWVDGFICGAGAHVLLADSNRNFVTLHHTWIAGELLPVICELYLRIGKWCTFEGETEVYEIKRERGFRKIQNKDDFSTCFPGAVITKITTEGYMTEEEKSVLGENFSLFPQAEWSEGIIKGESKSKGMQVILDATGIPRENTIAIGDSENDLDIIQYAKTGIAMGNACTKLKEAATAVTLPCGQGGVARALQDWAL